MPGFPHTRPTKADCYDHDAQIDHLTCCHKVVGFDSNFSVAETWTEDSPPSFVVHLQKYCKVQWLLGHHADEKGNHVPIFCQVIDRHKKVKAPKDGKVHGRITDNALRVRAHFLCSGQHVYCSTTFRCQHDSQRLRWDRQ